MWHCGYFVKIQLQNVLIFIKQKWADMSMILSAKFMLCFSAVGAFPSPDPTRSPLGLGDKDPRAPQVTLPQPVYPGDATVLGTYLAIGTIFGEQGNFVVQGTNLGVQLLILVCIS